MSAGRRGRLVRAIIGALVLLAFGGTVASAHPLGNFTINHYAGIRVELDRVRLDIVIDEAEIPTFQAVQALDGDADGTLSSAELEAARANECRSVGAALRLSVDGARRQLRLVEAGLAFPPGNGGLTTMRLVCLYEAPLAAPIASQTTIAFEDGYEPSRLGWREITAAGDGVLLDAPGVPTRSGTQRLTAYPTGLAGAPDVRSATFVVTPGGPALAALDVPDADPIRPVDVPLPGEQVGLPPAPAGSAAPEALPATGPTGATAAGPQAAGAVPGGEGVIPDILRSSPVTPAIALVSLLTAVLLGAGHALTPGHGKTLMAAYLVGTRGTPRHALGLGMAVSVSHTFGILGLALVVVAAERALPPDLVVRVAPVVAAVTILAIGGWMLVTELRRGLASRRARINAGDHASLHDHATAPDHATAHDHEHADGPDHAHEHPGAPHGHHDPSEHEHGGIRHRHVPAAGATITWRSLFVLGLAGGLIPSTNALLILLATIASGRPAWGIVLVVAFGLGMAAVMAGAGLVFVYARGLLDRAPSRTRLASAARFVPMGAAVLILGVGVVLTTQALAASPFR